jgi:hypothetical protein
MIRVFAKKSFGFRDPDNEKVLVRTTPGVFQELPEWVGKDDFFKILVKVGDIEVVQVAPKVAVSDKKKDGGK